MKYLVFFMVLGFFVINVRAETPQAALGSEIKRPECIMKKTVDIGFSVIRSDDDIKKMTTLPDEVIVRVLELAKKANVIDPKISSYNYNLSTNGSSFNSYEEQKKYKVNMQGSLKLGDTKNIADLMLLLEQDKMKPNMRVSVQDNCNNIRY